MKKIPGLLLFFILLYSCNNKKDAPDVSGIQVDLALQRFDVDFFALDTNRVTASIDRLNTKYPTFLPLFIQNIVAVEDSVGIKEFYSRYKQVFDSAQKIYSDFEPVKKEIELALKHVKHYFPPYLLPATITTVIGPMNTRQDLAQMSNGDYTPNFIGNDFIGISLQFYLGRDFSLYNHEYFITNVAPLYRSRRFSKEYIASDVMKLVTDDLFPDKSKGKPLVEQMVEKGRQWWLLDKLMPGTPDSIKTGYTQQQLEWCNANEGLIWSYIIKNEDINSINPVVIQNYIGDAPFTQGFSPQLSPGNIGQWIGWQIVKEYVEKNAGMKTDEIMRADPRKILEEAKYKPK